MGLYERGMQAMVGMATGKPSVEVGVKVWTVAMVQAEGGRVNTEIEALENDMSAWLLLKKPEWDKHNQDQDWTPELQNELRIQNSFRIDWDNFRGEWKSFYDKASSWPSNVYPVWEFEKRLIVWREKYRKFTGQEPTGEEPTEHGDPSFLGINWNRVFWAAVIIGGAYVGVKLLQATTPLVTSIGQAGSSIRQAGRDWKQLKAAKAGS